MSSAKWSGIEQKRYGLTGRWYVSAKYGYATDEGGWGLYNPSTNVDGWGGKKRPLATWDNAASVFAQGQCIVFDSGSYSGSVGIRARIVGDGDVKITSVPPFSDQSYFYNVKLIQTQHSNFGGFTDCVVTFNFGSIPSYYYMYNNQFYECVFAGVGTYQRISNIFARCGGNLAISENFMHNWIINSENLILVRSTSRPISILVDYSIIIGTVRTQIATNGKTTGVTIEDFKADGQYFRKSFSEVDLFGNASGSGASVAQLNEIFNNFYYPYIDDWQYLDLSLRPDVDDRVRYGGLNGHFIGALPVGYHFDIPTLWNTYQDAVNTTNVELNMMDRLIRTNPAIPGVYTSTVIVLPQAIDETDVAMFFKNNVYDSNGVAVQRLDYSIDPAKDSTLEQRTVYSYRMRTSPDDVTPLSPFKEYEIDRAPTVDASGNSNIDNSFDVATQQKQKIKQFIIEITLRSE